MMANSLFKLILVLIFLNSCSQPKTKREKKEIELEEVFEKSSSTSLFQNDQKRLTQFTSRDERSKDSSLDTLLKTVERAIRKEDLNLLLTLMDQEIVSSYGGGLIGHDDFLMNWERDYKKMWDKLSKILALGGTFTHPENYIIPDDGDAHQEAIKYDEMIVPHGYGITTNSKTKLYPNSKCDENEAVTVGRVYMVVDIESDYYGGLNEMWKVKIIGTGIHGFVKANDFYCASDYSLGIKKNTQGVWKIISFAPWD
jgi:hypothetical protein